MLGFTNLSLAGTYDNNVQNNSNANPQSSNNFSLSNGNQNSELNPGNWYENDNNNESSNDSLNSTFQDRFVTTVPIRKMPMIHPKGPSYWRLNQLFMESGINDYSQFDTCGRELDLLAEKSTNAQSLLTYSERLKNQVSVNPSTYHWCFYYWSLDLEQRMGSNVLARSYTAQHDFFIKRARGLLILARALRSQPQGSLYFSFLKNRYIDLSKIYFARELESFDGMFKGDSRR